MVLYSKLMYGSQFSGEKKRLKIRYLVAEILGKNEVLSFLGHPVVSGYNLDTTMFLVCLVLPELSPL